MDFLNHLIQSESNSTGGSWEGKLVYCHYVENRMSFKCEWTDIPSAIADFNSDCFVGDSFLRKEIRRAAAFSIELPQNFSQSTKRLLAHHFIEFETKDGLAITIEKNTAGILVQSCRHEGLPDRLVRRKRNGYQRSKLHTMELMKSSSQLRKETVIEDVFKLLHRQDELKNKYHYIDANCQEFVKAVWNGISLESFPLIQQYTRKKIYPGYSKQRIGYATQISGIVLVVLSFWKLDNPWLLLLFLTLGGILWKQKGSPDTMEPELEPEPEVDPSQDIPSNPSGAIHARVTANGFNYISEELKKQLEGKLNQLTIPNISGDKNHVKHEITNIHIRSIVPGSSSIQATSGGFRWQLSISEIKLKANWKFRYRKGMIKIADDGNAKGTIRNLALDVTLKPETFNGKLAVLPASIISPNCASVGDVHVDIGGSFMAWLYNILISAFEDNIRKMIPPAVCDAAGKALEKWSADIFPNMQTSDLLRILKEDFLADYSLLDPEFLDGLVNIRFKGEVFPFPKTFDSFPFSPSPMPSTASSKHIYLVISDFVTNTLLYSIQQKGLLRRSFSAPDDPDICNLLETSLKKLSIGSAESGGKDLNFSFDVLQKPKMTFSKADGILLCFNNAEVQVKSKDEDPLKILSNIKFSAHPSLAPDGRRLYFEFASPEVKVIKIEPIHWKKKLVEFFFGNYVLAEIDQRTQEVVNMAGEQFGISALNKLGKKGIELPNIKGKIDIVDRELIIEDGALVVAANLKSNL